MNAAFGLRVEPDFDALRAPVARRFFESAPRAAFFEELLRVDFRPVDRFLRVAIG
jgi:hypothetical protein